jgi:hypothetical protein
MSGLPPDCVAKLGFSYERGRVASLIARLFALRLTELRHD